MRKAVFLAKSVELPCNSACISKSSANLLTLPSVLRVSRSAMSSSNLSSSKAPDWVTMARECTESQKLKVTAQVKKTDRIVDSLFISAEFDETCKRQALRMASLLIQHHQCADKRCLTIHTDDSPCRCVWDWAGIGLDNESLRWNSPASIW